MRLFIALLLVAGIVNAAPAPYPVTIDSRAQTIPKLTVYRAGQADFALTFKDGATASDLGGSTAWMSWSTSNTASTCVTALVSTVTATSGTARATFAASDLNYAAGRYVYEVGVSSNGTAKVYRQGVFEIVGSPYATGGTSPAWTTNQPWALITGKPDTIAGYGITDAKTFAIGDTLQWVGSGITNSITMTLTNMTWTIQGTNYYLP